MASNLVVDTLTKGGVTLNTDEIVDVNNTRVCKAWVNFNGTGTPAIRASYNVSSITDNGTGDYSISMTTDMVDADYAAFVSASRSDANRTVSIIEGTFAVGSIRFRSAISTNAVSEDSATCSVSIFR